MGNDVIILIAEDDIGHFILTKRHLRQAGISNKIIHLPDGQAASNYLHQECINAEDNTKFILLLDIRMPKIDGIEILEMMKKNPKLQKIPVIIVTTSDNPANIKKCKELGCQEYIVKPIGGSLTKKVLELAHKLQSVR